jgi:hypothetical protein
MRKYAMLVIQFNRVRNEHELQFWRARQNLTFDVSEWPGCVNPQPAT